MSNCILLTFDLHKNVTFDARVLTWKPYHFRAKARPWREEENFPRTKEKLYWNKGL